jgi:hypothetical protein
MQSKLLDQRLAQFGIVVDNQDLADIRHRAGPKDQCRRFEGPAALAAISFRNFKSKAELES